MITQTEIEVFIKHLLKAKKDGGSGLAAKTVQDILAVIKSIFRYAKSGQSIDFHSIKIKSEHKEMRVLTQLEQAKLTSYLNKNADAAKLGVLLSLYMGIRIGELCALRWQDIDLTAKKLHVKETMQRIANFDGVGAKTKIVITSPKSGCSLRTIPLPDFLVVLLKKHQRNPQAYVLTAEKLRWIEPRTLQYRFKSMLKKAGVADANFHALRHSFSTRAVEIGFDIKTLSEILGHSKIESVNMTRTLWQMF